MSQKQIQGLNFLAMGTNELRDEIYKAVSENPALEIVRDPQYSSQHSREAGGTGSRTGTGPDPSYSQGSSYDSDRLQQAIENREDKTETLQAHLMHQLNSINMTQDEYDLSQRLIYNLDKNGCYGSSISPETLLDKTRPLQTPKLLQRCIQRIQKMDPVGTCCRTLEESLYVQAKISGEASDLTLFILDGNLELLSPPEPEKIMKKLADYKREYHKKKFAAEIILDKIQITEELIEESINFILTLNPRPAQGYTQDTLDQYEQPDIVVSVKKVPGPVRNDDFSKGIIYGDDKFHFQLKYASGVLPEIRISPEFLAAIATAPKNNKAAKEAVQNAKNFMDNLAFRESSLVLQCCTIVSYQKDFFLYGPDHLKPLTRRTVADHLGIHQSTVSRLTAKKGSKYIQTEQGTLPLSYFFSSGLSTKADSDVKVSAEVVKLHMAQIINDSPEPLSDLKLTKILNEKGIKIARRTVAKYRNLLGIENSYER